MNRKTLLATLCASLLSVSMATASTLVKDNRAEPSSLDPQVLDDVASFNVVQDLFEGLLIMGPNGEFLPGVAKSWTISKDKLVYTFNLRKDAKWSDGTEVTANDFVYGMQRSEDPKVGAVYAYLLYCIKNAEEINYGKRPLSDLGVKAINDHTLEITLKNATPYFLALLTQPSTYPADEKSIKKWGKAHTKPGHLVSNGAYKLKEHVVNGHIELEKNSYYWDNKDVQIDTVKYLPLTQATTSMRMFQGGQVDWGSMTSSQYREMKSKYPKQVHAAPYFRLYFVNFNMNKEPFKSNLKLRKALSMAVDRKAITDHILGQGQIPSYSYVPEGTNGIKFTEYEWAKWPRENQVKTALKLFKEAGYSEDNPLEFTMIYNTAEDDKKLMLAIQSMWRSTFGSAINVKIENQEWKVFLKTREHGEYQVSRGGWTGDYNYANTFLELYTCGNALNDSNFCDPRVDKAIDSAAYANTEQERINDNTRAEKMAMDSYNIIPVFQHVAVHLINPKLKGYTGKNVLDYIRSADMTLED